MKSLFTISQFALLATTTSLLFGDVGARVVAPVSDDHQVTLPSKADSRDVETPNTPRIAVAPRQAADDTTSSMFVTVTMLVSKGATQLITPTISLPPAPSTVFLTLSQSAISPSQSPASLSQITATQSPFIGVIAVTTTQVTQSEPEPTSSVTSDSVSQSPTSLITSAAAIATSTDPTTSVSTGTSTNAATSASTSPSAHATAAPVLDLVSPPNGIKLSLAEGAGIAIAVCGVVALSGIAFLFYKRRMALKAASYHDDDGKDSVMELSDKELEGGIILSDKDIEAGVVRSEKELEGGKLPRTTVREISPDKGNDSKSKTRNVRWPQARN